MKQSECSSVLSMTAQRSSDDDGGSTPVVPLPTTLASSGGPFAVPGIGNSDYTDGRSFGQWESKYPHPARRCITQEACILGIYFFALLLFSAAFVGLSTQSLQVPITWLASGRSSLTNNQVPILNIDFKLLSIFFVGCLGGTTFSIKWLMHSAAKGIWHLDRRYWRLLVPLIGGVYACVVLTLLDGGVIAAHSDGQPSYFRVDSRLFLPCGIFLRWSKRPTIKHRKRGIRDTR